MHVVLFLGGQLHWKECHPARVGYFWACCDWNATVPEGCCRRTWLDQGKSCGHELSNWRCCGANDGRGIVANRTTYIKTVDGTDETTWSTSAVI